MAKGNLEMKETWRRIFFVLRVKKLESFGGLLQAQRWSAAILRKKKLKEKDGTLAKLFRAIPKIPLFIFF